MPSKSKKQERLMRAIAHGWKKPGGGGPSKEVAEEFMRADMAARERWKPPRFDGGDRPVNYVIRRLRKKKQLGPYKD